jgi:hypothetical protein
VFTTDIACTNGVIRHRHSADAAIGPRLEKADLLGWQMMRCKARSSCAVGLYIINCRPS